MKSGRQKERGVLVFLLSDGESVIRNLAGVMRAAKERGWRTQIAPSKLLKDGNGLHFALAPNRDYAYVPWISDERWSRERGDAFARLVSGSGKRFHGFPGETGKTGEPASPGNAFRERLASWLQELPKPVGLFAANDAVASDVLKACTSLGLAVQGCDGTHPPCRDPRRPPRPREGASVESRENGYRGVCQRIRLG